MRNSFDKPRRDGVRMSPVFSRLKGGVTVLFDLLVAISIVAPSFRISDPIRILGIGAVAIGFASKISCRISLPVCSRCGPSLSVWPRR
jgi:hypothetical protein